MQSKEVVREYKLTIRHYKGDQTHDELMYPCEKCLFVNNNTDCRLFKRPVRECLRDCISNYRLDIETLMDSMYEKMEMDNKKWNDWLNSFPDFMEEDDAILYVIKKPDDIVQVHRDLEKMLGE